MASILKAIGRKGTLKGDPVRELTDADCELGRPHAWIVAAEACSQANWSVAYLVDRFDERIPLRLVAAITEGVEDGLDRPVDFLAQMHRNHVDQRKVGRLVTRQAGDFFQ